jgi:NAD(P)-dependent dehydrogenase (short-subunit alcohol dehydrogenase family)
VSGRLEGKTAWISGAASGIGEAAARLFAAEGARVALADTNREGLERVASEIRQGGGVAALAQADVGRENEVAASVQLAAAELGGLQILVNCAGIVQVRLLHESTEEEWDRLMAVNLKSIFFSLKHGRPYLKLNSESWIVNVASVSSFIGQASTPAYTTSKSALLGLTRSIALDYATDGIRCNCVCPGITDTPMLRAHLNTMPDPEASLRSRVRRVPMNRALSPSEIARTILYLSSEESAGVTGTCVVVDGGYTAAAEWQAP